jgi:hypothetical protein
MAIARSSQFWVDVLARISTPTGTHILIILLFLPSPGVFSAEYQDTEDIAAKTAEESTVGMRDTGRVLQRPRRYLLRDVLAERSEFWRDSSLELNLRPYDLKRENGEKTISEALAIGTELTFRSGQWRDRLSAVVSWHTSNGIDTPEDKALTGILGPDQSDLSVISRAYVEARIVQNTSFRLFRQDFDMPYINRNDSRMIPNTHEAFVVRHPGEKFQYVAGYITKMKQRDSEEFVPMADVAGVDGDDSGTTVGAARYQVNDETTLAAQAFYTRDLFSSSYLEASFARTINEDWGTQLAAQLTNQWSVGDQLLGDFDSYTGGLRARVSYRGTILTAAITHTGEAAIRKPFGGTPGFTSSMLFDFDRAREEAYRIGLSYNFERIGFPGVGLIMNYTHGRGAEDNDGHQLRETDEFALTADLRPERGLFKGLWLRVRYADADRGAPEADRREIRIIANYSLGAN